MKRILLVISCLLLIAAAGILYVLIANTGDANVVQEPITGELKVMTYNVLEGLDDTNRRDAFINYMIQSEVDVLAIQELNGMKEHDLLELAKAYDHSYAIQLKSSGYPVGITSKYPISLIKKLRFGFHHGVLHVKIRDMNYFIVHLSPLSAEKRTKEMTRLIDYIHKVLPDETEKVMILGDFNAHSITDALSLEHNNLVSTIDEKNLVDGKISFETIKVLTDQGFIDSYDYLNNQASRISATYPTDDLENRGERIDYIFVSKSLESSLSTSVIDMNPNTLLISDHLPIITTFNLK